MNNNNILDISIYHIQLFLAVVEECNFSRAKEALRPDILIEDDCKSIGDAWQRCIHKVKVEIKQQIKSIVVFEVQGIDHLPVDINNLMNYR